MSVKSVYNFVPAPTEKEVFKPDWAEQVSHDIPFSDGESGEIEFTIYKSKYTKDKSRDIKK